MAADRDLGRPWNGEIDIVEGANTQERNQMTLHTGPGCEISQQQLGAGKVLHESCDAFYNSNVGCGIQDPSTRSYGQGFNSAGGGVWATVWNEDGISIYFFTRGNIPADITSQSPNPQRWGKPRAFFSNDDCTIKNFFGDQTIVINTTLCGDWAGSTYPHVGCPGTCSQRVTNPQNFNSAFWKINVSLLCLISSCLDDADDLDQYVRLYSPIAAGRGRGGKDL